MLLAPAAALWAVFRGNTGTAAVLMRLSELAVPAFGSR